MTLFLLSFFTLYSLAHLYVFIKARSALAFGAGTGIVIGLVMAFMTVAPVLVRQLEKAGWEASGRVLSHIGYLWLGLIFLFVSWSLLTDLCRFGIYVVSTISGKEVPALVASRRPSFFVPLILSLSICFYGYFEALNIRLERVEIRTDKLPPGLERLRIVQISDVHVGLIVRQSRVQRIMDKVREADPDILISTGDLVDGQLDGLDGIAELFNEVSPRFGKFAIIGNHEFYAGLSQSIAFTEKAGFRLLRGEGLSDLPVNIAGFDDPTGRYFGVPEGRPETEVLKGLSKERFTLLLKHRPFVSSGSLGLFDLQLSGHTHKGQIFPFSLITYFYYPVHAGFSAVGRGSVLYVSRGSGTWGPPIRFLAPPEVTLIELVKGSGG
jgi:uncharacterized protein